jgi:hypothetical protein
VLPFEALTQGGFGTPATFDPATILSLKWIVAFPDIGQAASADRFDFQLDDVAFATDEQAAQFVPPPSPPMMGGPILLPSPLPAARAVPQARTSSGAWPGATPSTPE